MKKLILSILTCIIILIIIFGIYIAKNTNNTKSKNINTITSIADKNKVVNTTPTSESSKVDNTTSTPESSKVVDSNSNNTKSTDSSTEYNNSNNTHQVVDQNIITYNEKKYDIQLLFNPQNYYGTYTLNKEIGYQNLGGLPNAQVPNLKLILTKDLYSYNGITIKNPTYYCITTKLSWNTGADGIHSDIGKGNMGDTLTYIYAVPSNTKITKEYYLNNMLYNNKVPFLIVNLDTLNNTICAWNGPNNNQIYEFKKDS